MRRDFNKARNSWMRDVNDTLMGMTASSAGDKKITISTHAFDDGIKRRGYTTHDVALVLVHGTLAFFSTQSNKVSHEQTEKAVFIGEDMHGDGTCVVLGRVPDGYVVVSIFPALDKSKYMYSVA